MMNYWEPYGNNEKKKRKRCLGQAKGNEDFTPFGIMHMGKMKWIPFKCL